MSATGYKGKNLKQKDKQKKDTSRIAVLKMIISTSSYPRRRLGVRLHSSEQDNGLFQEQNKFWIDKA